MKAYNIFNIRNTLQTFKLNKISLTSYNPYNRKKLPFKNFFSYFFMNTKATTLANR